MSADLVAWADVIFVMERQHRRKLLSAYRQAAKDKQIAVLGIRDKYQFIDPELVSLFREEMRCPIP